MDDSVLVQIAAVYGPMGLMLLWFAWRLERVLTRLTKEIRLNSVAIIRLLERHDSEMASTLSKELYHGNGSDL